MIESAVAYSNSMDDTQNISIFKRPPPLKQRPSGKLLQVIAASFMLSIAYPAYQFVYESMFLQKDLKNLRQEHNELSKKSNSMRIAMSKVQKDKKEIEKKLSIKSKDLDFRTNLLKEIEGAYGSV